MTPDPIPARLAALKSTSTLDLKRQWRDLFTSEPPPFNRRYLENRLAYRIQELAYGGLKPETIRRLERLGEELDGGKATHHQHGLTRNSEYSGSPDMQFDFGSFCGPSKSSKLPDRISLK